MRKQGCDPSGIVVARIGVGFLDGISIAPASPQLPDQDMG